jgi:hypothetical protein
LNGNAPVIFPPAHRPKNRKKCDETVKKRGELVMGAFFEPKKRRSISLSRQANVHLDKYAPAARLEIARTLKANPSRPIA